MLYCQVSEKKNKKIYINKKKTLQCNVNLLPALMIIILYQRNQP